MAGNLNLGRSYLITTGLIISFIAVYVKILVNWKTVVKSFKGFWRRPGKCWKNNNNFKNVGENAKNPLAVMNQWITLILNPLKPISKSKPDPPGPISPMGPMVPISPMYSMGPMGPIALRQQILIQIPKVNGPGLEPRRLHRVTVPAQ